MGSSSSKFKKYLQNGDEYAAMQVYQGSSELRKELQPNFSYGDHHDHNTPLHYAARHGMKHLIRTFLNDLNGNPNNKNVLRQTSLHCVCNISHQKSPSALERRAYSVMLLLSWRGPVLPNGERERIDLNAQDDYGYTALHYAAQSGLRKCLEYLVAHGADLFKENKEGFTPCDLAMRENFHHIAQFLESKMVFSGTPESLSGDSSCGGPRTSSFEGEEEVYCGLRAQDLQEAKDQLLVETADMLHIPLFTAEALLRHAEWSRENLLDHWMRDPVQTCQLAGVQPPYSALMRHSSLSQYEQISRQYHHDEEKKEKEKKMLLAGRHLTPKIHSENSFIVDEELAEDGILCEICCDLMTPTPSDGGDLMTCGHKFCRKCWRDYLHTKIQEGNAHRILCPAFDCSILVPVQVIERNVSPGMARKYLKFDINAFVETNKAIRWCPYPACQRAVSFPESEQQQSAAAAAGNNVLLQVSHAVDCGAGHFFCWECGAEAHAPTSCSLWQLWLTRCAKVDPSELQGSGRDFQEAANCLWLVTHSKPCPNCQMPIQKNEGCNHMKCSKCRHDFCWVCLEAWKKHSSATGGYFRCNRFTTLAKPEEDQGKQVSRMSEKTRKLRELNRFVHFYTRYKNHDNSRKMEEPLQHSAKTKRELLQSSLNAKARLQGRQTMDTLGRNTKFYEDGVWELLKARQILCGSYAYGFYLAEDNGNNSGASSSSSASSSSESNIQSRVIFEFMQNELEEVTERLSEMIARPYLRTPRRSIIQTIQLCRRKRQELLRACYKGLVPPESASSSRQAQFQGPPVQQSPPKNPSNAALMRSQVNHMVGVDIDRKRLVESISDHLYGRGNLWTRDDVVPPEQQGSSHCSKCRRPSCASEQDHQYLQTARPQFDFNSLRRSVKPGELLQQQQLQQQQQPWAAMQQPKQAVCKSQTMDPGQMAVTKQKHHLRHRSSVPAAKEVASPGDDYNMDLMLALEMSHMQMVRDGLIKPGTKLKRSSRSDDNLLSSASEDQQLKMAIELSLKDAEQQRIVAAKKAESKKSKTFAKVKLSSKSISTDGAEGRALPEAEDESNKPEDQTYIKAANETVSSFLKSLTLQELQEEEDDEKIDVSERSVVQSSSAASNVVKRTGGVAEGQFKIGELHEAGGYKEASKEAIQANLKRSQSTGDMDDHPKSDPEVPFIDSDHSCSDRPENSGFSTTTVKIDSTSSSDVTAKAEVLNNEALSREEKVSSLSTAKRARPKFVRQKSFEIDSDGTDVEGSLVEQISAAQKRSSLPKEEAGEDKENNKKETLLLPPAANEDTSSSKTSEDGSVSNNEKKAKKKRPGLTIKIHNSSFLEDDGVNEFETSLAKSPTMHISGISISRSPGGKDSPMLPSPKNASSSSPSYLATPNNRNRSSSLIVPPPTPAQQAASSSSPGSKSLHLSRGGSPSAIEPPPARAGSSLFTFPPCASPSLSSVLHVHDNYLSSDDFHEALFFEKSPKAVKKRRRSRRTGSASGTPKQTKSQDGTDSPLKT